MIDRRSRRPIILIVGSRSSWWSPEDCLNHWLSIILIVSDLYNFGRYDRLMDILINDDQSLSLTIDVVLINNNHSDGQWPIVMTHDDWLSWWSMSTNCLKHWGSLTIFTIDERSSSPRHHTFFSMDDGFE